MKSLDIRSEPAVRLLSEFLDMDAERGHERANAEHFAHGKYMKVGPRIDVRGRTHPAKRVTRLHGYFCLLSPDFAYFLPFWF